jgi:exonuclease SbcD
MPQPLRFVHAGDLQLERPLSGLAEIPAHLTDLLIDAPYAAAERVFELAQSEHADFLILAGNVVNIDRAGPRAIAFLLDQFERLAARDIAVYWLAGPAERRGPWPSELKLPPNVHPFGRAATQSVVHHADGDDLAELIGYGAATEERSAPAAKNKSGRYTIGVKHGPFHGRSSGKLPGHYWACGGARRHRDATSDGRQVIHSGTPQARSPAQRGAHGAIAVEVDEHGVAHPRFVATDLARYARMRVEIDLAAPRADQEHALADRVQAALDKAPGIDLFLRWQIVPVSTSGSTSAALGMSREAWGQAWLRWLRQEFGTDSPAAWSSTVDVVMPRRRKQRPPQDGSLLADFLSAVDDAEREREEVPLDRFVPEHWRHAQVADLLRVDEKAERARVLRQARLLGNDLLGAEELSA